MSNRHRTVGRPAMAGTAAVALVAAMASFGAIRAGASAPNSTLPATQRPLSAAAAIALRKNVVDPVIVVMKDQPAVASPGSAADTIRQRRFAADQAPVLSELHDTDAVKMYAYQLVNAVAATVSPGEAARLAANPAVSEVIPDVEIPGSAIGPQTPITAAAAHTQPAKAIPPGACPAPGQPALFGEDLQLIHDAPSTPGQPSAQSLGFTGAGVTVAFLADGLDINNPDFIRPDGSHVFVAYKDFTGDGVNAPTQGGEAFEDASAIASQGKVYDVSDYGATPLDAPCRIRVEGVAPGASLVGLKIVAQNGYTTLSSLLQAIDYAVTVAHVNVLNQSDGLYNTLPNIQSEDILDQFDNAAVAAGTTVTAATGDAGVGNTFDSPGNDPLVIAAGASTAYRWDAETSNDGYQPPFAVKGWLSDNISALSSSGYGYDGLTNNLVAPGDTSIAACTPDVAMYADCASYANKPAQIEWSGGTSEAAPLTAGTAALVIQAYRHTHGGASPTPAQIKQIILSTTDDLGHPADEQGSGLLDTYRAVLAAESAPGSGVTPTRIGSEFLLSANSLNATAAPATAESWPVTITSVGQGTETLTLGTRTLGPPLDTTDRTVTLTDRGPQFVNEYGETENYQTVKFGVAPGRARLEVDIAYQGNTSPPSIPPPPLATAASDMTVVLIDPEGNYAADGFAQGDGNANHVEVRDPAFGTWTALIFSDTTREGGSTGPVHFQAQTFDDETMGTVNPSRITLASGSSATFTVHMTTPATAGDADASVTIAGAFGQASSLPVTLHSLVELSTGGHFDGVLIGGNGRQSDIGQTAFYRFDLPRSAATASALNATLILADHQTDPALGYLVDPAGDVVASTTNELVTGFAAGEPVETAQSALSLTALDPAAGQWTLILSFAPVITGNQVVTPYTGQVSLGADQAAAPTLPDTPNQVLNAGVPVVVPVRVHNPGPAPQDYFIDPRLARITSIALAPQSPASMTLPIPADGASASWLVPTDTTSLSLSAESAAAVTFDWGQAWGDPDLGATSAGDTASGSYTSSPVAPGDWFADPAEIGPFPPGGAPPESSSMDATARTQAFDPAITTAAGDLWTQSVDPAAPLGVFTIGAGRTAIIDVTITPSGPSGQTVTGDLYVDQLGELSSAAANAQNFKAGQQYLPTGNQVASIPYQYRIR